MSTTTVTPDEDIVSSSDLVAMFEAMTPDVLHTEMLSTHDGYANQFFKYEAVVMVTRQRLANGEIVGEETVWSKYVSRYLLKDEEKLPTALRRLSRLILKIGDGKTIDSSRVNHRPKTNRVVVEESIRRQEYARGVADTLKANSFTVDPTVNPFPAVAAPPFVPPTVTPTKAAPTATETFYVVLNGDDTAPNLVSAVDREEKRFQTLEKAQKRAVQVTLHGDEFPMIMKVDAAYTFTPCPLELPTGEKP